MYVGLDVHKRVCYGTVMNEKGTVLKQASFTNDPEGLMGFIEGLYEAVVAMETGMIAANVRYYVVKALLEKPSPA